MKHVQWIRIVEIYNVDADDYIDERFFFFY